MAISSCPICRARLQRDDTHCPRCGIRIAAIERRPRRVDSESAQPLPVSALRGGVSWGLRLLAADVLVAAVWALVRGGFLRALDTAAVVSGGLALCVALALGGVRIFRWAGGDPEDLRRHARGEAAAGRERTRISLVIVGAVCLVLAVGLAITGH